MKKIAVLIKMLLFFIFLPVLSYGADTFSVTVPAGTEVTMQDPDAVVPFTVTNIAGSTKNIREITFTVDTTKYNISSSTVPPSGWCVKTIDIQTVVFSQQQPSGTCSSGSTANEITPGTSTVFNITVLPLSAASDVTTDTLTGVSIGAQGGFTRSGVLPTWTRRSLEASLSAAPDSTGVGNTITVTMQVTNRSTAAQSSISSTPNPPAISSAIVSNTAGPYYGSTLLNGNHNVNASVINVSSTSEFTAAGTIRIDSEDICYTAKTATSFIGITRGCNSTTAESHVSGSAVYSLDAFSLTSGQTRTIIWQYSADNTGSVYFSARATNKTGTATSPLLNSNTVIIGNFTASLSITPSSVITGQTITAQMLATNNSSSAIVNISPSILAGCPGGATELLVSGPTPSNISSLASGSSGVFYWTYQITGSVGHAYCLSGYASANGPITTNTANSNTGYVSNYSVTLAPSVASSATVNLPLTWTVYNGGGCSVNQVDIQTPAAGGNWSCSSVTAPAGWSGPCSNTVQFQSGNSANDIASGSTKSFTITFSTTEAVTSDKVVSFPLTITARGCSGQSNTLGSTVTLTANSLSFAHTPTGPLYADGSSYYTMTTTLTSGGNPVAGKTITFSTTNGTLNSSSAITDANGQATVNLIAPNSTTNTNATVTASYLTASDTDTVNFTAWTQPNLQYWGSLSPMAVSCGTAYSFAMQIKNISATGTMALNTSSYFAFNDSSAGGNAIYKAFLNSPVSILPGAIQTVTFGSPTNAGGGGGVSIPSSFIAGVYSPIVNSSPPPESGLFLSDGGANDQYRTVTDNITAGGDCGTVKINVIEWFEMR
ncbi:MAG: Ig-like domain-containing protein [Deltaproteobacteria bacterium]|nr:Ig-like domain-containing protein [Deltaproteobacteria bacterium]